MISYKVATDGLCKNNQAAGLQKGTWAFVVFSLEGESGGGKSGHSEKTTNNEMELKAILEALHWANRHKVSIEILTDSEYAMKGILEWSKGWQARGWKTASNEPVKNKELFQAILLAYSASKDHKFTKVKGHSGNKFNDAADSRCNEEYINAFI